MNNEIEADSSTTAQTAAQLPPISIVMIVRNNAQELEAHLPMILAQDYPPGFEVIAVMSKSDDDTEIVLERMMREHPVLRTTFIPDSSRYMSRRKLGITLGVKAARNEWILLTEPTCMPLTEQWLRLMASHCEAGTDMVMGYSNYDNEASDYRRVERALAQRRLLHETKRTAYRTEGNNLLFRKQMFMEGRGYDGNTQFARGEYNFLVNKYAKRGNVAVEYSPNARLLEDAPTDKSWADRHLHYISNRNALRRSFRHRLPFNIRQTLIHVWYVLLLIAIVVSAMQQMWMVLACAAGAFVITFVLHVVVMKKVLDEFEPDIDSIKAVFFDLGRAYCALYYRWKYSGSDRNEFTTHKL